MDQWYDTYSTGGHFVGKDSQFRNWVTADGSASPIGTDGFPAEKNHYRLYASHAYRWAMVPLSFAHSRDWRI